MRLLLLGVALAVSSPKRASPNAIAPLPAGLFGGATNVRTDGPELQLVSDRGFRVRLQPVRYMPAPGRSEALNSYRCGVLIRSGRQPTALETVGRGDTEALSCGGMIAAGFVGGPASERRIALVYKTQSPNETSRTPIIILRKGAPAHWIVDEGLSSKLADQLDHVTLADIRRALRQATAS